MIWSIPRVNIPKREGTIVNKSHAACYSLLGFLTAWLKLYYPAEFWAAVLSITEDSKRDRYLKLITEEKISICPPDINVSDKNFTSSNGKILYGLGRIKGVGEATVDSILEERKKGPFADLADINSRMPKKVLRQNTVFSLIKAGAFSFEHDNRYVLLNRQLDIRKDKKTMRYDEDQWSETACQNMEVEVIESSITYPFWWNGIKDGEPVKDTIVTVLGIKEHNDKNGGLMCFCTLDIKNCKVEGVMFAKNYRDKGGVDLKKDQRFKISGKKNKDKLIINSVKPALD